MPELIHELEYFADCSGSLSSNPPGPWPAPKPGRTDDDATNTAPVPATTGARKPPAHGHNDLRLDY